MVKCPGRDKRVKKVAPADHTHEAKSVCGCGQSTLDVKSKRGHRAREILRASRAKALMKILVKFQKLFNDKG